MLIGGSLRSAWSRVALSAVSLLAVLSLSEQPVQVQSCSGQYIAAGCYSSGCGQYDPDFLPGNAKYAYIYCWNGSQWVLMGTSSCCSNA